MTDGCDVFVIIGSCRKRWESFFIATLRRIIYLKDEVIANKFLRDAEAEGFTFGDGAKPTSRPGNNLYVVNKDWTVSHVGMAGHMAYQLATMIGDQRLIRMKKPIGDTGPSRL